MGERSREAARLWEESGRGLLNRVHPLEELGKPRTPGTKEVLEGKGKRKGKPQDDPDLGMHFGKVCGRVYRT